MPEQEPVWAAAAVDKHRDAWEGTELGQALLDTASAQNAASARHTVWERRATRWYVQNAGRKWRVNKAQYTRNRAREEEEDVLRLLIERATSLEDREEFQLREELDLPAHEFSALIARLTAKGWLRRDGAKLSLTPIGTEVARNLLDRHQTAERFFNEILGEPPDAAHAVAEKLEHVISRRALDELKDSLARARGATPLVELSLNERGTVVAVKDPGGRSFSRLMGIGLSPGGRLKLIGRLPNKAVIVEINGGKAAIAAQIARAILVRKDPEHEDRRSSWPTELG